MRGTPPWLRRDSLHPHCAPPPRRNPLLWYIKARLHRRIFLGMAAAILTTGFAVTAVFSALHEGPTWRDEMARVERFMGGRFAATWHDTPARDALADALARDMDVDVSLYAADGTVLTTRTPSGLASTPACASPSFTVKVRDPSGALLGAARACTARHRNPRGAWHSLAGLGAAIVVLWAVAGMTARRLTRPLTELVRVVTAIGEGKLESRMQLSRHDAGELGAIAHAVNEMAGRIAKQLDDQRNLLAAVSHEIRSPLARLRFMVETLRDGEPAREKTLDDVDREMEGIDALVGDLLATSRMDFDALKPVALDAADVAARALDRAGLDASLRVLDGSVGSLRGDATLVHTALGNLLANARKHGGRVVALRVTREEGLVRFAVDDDGEGFAPEELPKVFEPFYRGERAQRAKGGGVGLGLALVRRIAEVHGGSARAENLPGRGARVSVAFPAA